MIAPTSFISFLKRSTIIRIVLFLFPIFILITGINYFIDPGNLFCKVPVEEKVLEFLIKGSNVKNIANLNDRFLIKEYISKQDTLPGVAVLGSSRLQQIRAHHLNCSRLINCWVPHADIYDILGIFYLFLEKKQIPKTVLLGMEPWMLNDNNPNKEWKILKEDCNKMLDSIGFPEGKIDSRFEIQQTRFTQLFSPSYFQQSIKYLIKFNFKKIEIAPTILEENIGPTRMADLSFSYEEEFRNKNPEKVAEDAKNFMTSSNNRAYYSGYKVLSVNRKKILRAFIDYLLRKHVNVLLYSPPYHPVAYGYLKKDLSYKMGIEAGNFYKELALEKKVHIIGSMNPNDYHLSNNYFYDYFHCKPIALDTIFNRHRIKI